MNGLLFAFVLALLAGIGARDQMTVAALSAGLGRHAGLLLVALATAALACAAAAWAAGEMAPVLGEGLRLPVASFAMVAAGLESLLLGPRRAPKEPTRSLSAAAIVLLADQILDAARFLVLAMALVTHSPAACAVGGALASAAVLGLAWLEGGRVLGARRLLRRLRLAAGAVLLLAGGLLGAWVAGWIGGP
ncbi:MAG TPA: hypothetical protein VFF98_13415 [Novosphingobium sp.]|nr:hypothetical protein [Novosphingobium sp.]